MTDGELDQRLRDSILSEEVDTSRVAAAVRKANPATTAPCSRLGRCGGRR